MEFSNIWYVDESEVEAIWSQIRSTVEVTKSTERAKSFWGSLKANISKWKLVSGETGGEINVSEKVSIIEKEGFSIYRKVFDIIKELGEEAVSLQEELLATENTHLVYVRGYFAIEEIFLKGKPEKM